MFNRILTDRIDELPGLADDLLVTILMLDIGARKLTGARTGTATRRS